MTLRALTMVGNFRELGYLWDAPSLLDARGKRSAAHRAEVVAYLRCGTRYLVSPGPVRDVFDPTRFAGTASVLTDGVFAWPDALAHYVERYDVELPAAFEEHMRACAWRPPATVELDPVALPWEL